MNIFVFGTRGFPYIQGGVEKHCENLYPLLPPRYRIVVFRRKPYVKELDRHYENIRFIDLPSTKIKGLEALIHSFLSTFYLLFKKTDIVHIHNIGPAFFSPLLKLRRRKIILTYHSPNYEHKKWNFIGKTLLRISEKIALSTSDVIIFVSNKQINKYGKKIKEKSVFIPNGINLPQISSDTRFLDSWNLIPRKYILAVGRITQEKGFDYLIGAFQKAQLPADYKLVIAGGADAEQSYFNSLKKMPSRNVIFTDYVFGEALAQLYSHAALFVLPSFNEGFPIVLLEAMSYRLPIAASDIEADKEIELPDDSYFPVGNEEALAEKIREKITAPHRNIEYDLSRLNWKNIAEQTTKVYEKK